MDRRNERAAQDHRWTIGFWVTAILDLVISMVGAIFTALWF